MYDKKKNHRIAIWNIERPKNTSSKTKLVLDQIKTIDEDIIVLTETSNAVQLEPYYNAIKSVPFERNPEEQWVTIWSKWKILDEVKTFDNQRTACALIETPFGKILIYGTIIPYHMARVSGARYNHSGYKAWEFHYEDIDRQFKDWMNIQKQFSDVPFFVIGDFNQTRDQLPKGYETIKGRDLLGDKLQDAQLRCVTGIDFSKTGQLSVDPKRNKVRNNIDHICISKNLLEQLEYYNVGAWDQFTSDGNCMSDHNSVNIDFVVD